MKSWGWSDADQVKSTLLDDIQKIMQEGDSREKVNFEEEKSQTQLQTRQKFHKTLFPQILEAKIEDQGGPFDFLLRQELFTLARVTTDIYLYVWRQQCTMETKKCICDM